jgi:RNA polymerase-binding protein DksA
MKKPPAKPPAHSYIPASVGRLMDPKNPIRRPLIPSGPKAAHIRPLGSPKGEDGGADAPKAKSPFGKKEIEKYRQILIKKRAELVGDVATMENEALRGQSGSLSNMPQHLAEQGSEAYDQALSLDLAAADRKLIREIDEALKRIENGTYGVCELTGKPISLERLEELPWARYSIEAAREMERQHLRG